MTDSGAASDRQLLVEIFGKVERILARMDAHDARSDEIMARIVKHDDELDRLRARVDKAEGSLSALRWVAGMLPLPAGGLGAWLHSIMGGGQ